MFIKSSIYLDYVDLTIDYEYGLIEFGDLLIMISINYGTLYYENIGFVFVRMF